MRGAITALRGVPHSLEIVGTSAGVTWLNDSIATSPERTIAGLESFTEPVVLLLGGRDKNLPLDGLRELAKRRCRAVICYGEAGPLFAAISKDKNAPASLRSRTRQLAGVLGVDAIDDVDKTLAEISAQNDSQGAPQ